MFGLSQGWPQWRGLPAAPWGSGGRGGSRVLVPPPPTQGGQAEEVTRRGIL